jgi:hypothetical protein
MLGRGEAASPSERLAGGGKSEGPKKRKTQYCVLRNTGLSVEEHGKFRSCWTPESCEAASPAERLAGLVKI